MAQTKTQKTVPIVFISSTSEDLKEHRAAARDAAIPAGFLPSMMEYFTASGKRRPLKACLAKVDEADLVVAIVAHRYGWVPGGKRNSGGKSITWLECEHAVKKGKEVIAFLVHEKHAWPTEFREESRLMSAALEGKAQELVDEVQRNLSKLQEFKDWLNGLGLRKTFTTPEDLRGKIEAALRESQPQPPSRKKRAPQKRAPKGDPRKYLNALREETAYIDIRGLVVGSGKAHRFSIEELFIPLTTASQTEEPSKAARGKRPSRSRAKKAAKKAAKGRAVHDLDAAQREPVQLHEALTNKRLVIVGDPGSGKTTFLRRIAFALCETTLDEVPDAAESRLGIRGQPFPVFVRIAELLQHMRNARKAGLRDAPTIDDAPAWLPHFLTTANKDSNWGLSESFFKSKLQDGACILLLDGLDEAPNRRDREIVARLVEKATQAYEKCRFVVTTRPQAYTGRAVLAAFPQVQIDPLETDAIKTFLQRWSEALFHESAGRAEQHCSELLAALRNLPEVRRMARNPVMLTALAVVHWNEHRLPEQRADLYESIILWLLRSREQRPGRASADRCATLLGNLALAMQSHSGGRQVQVSKRWAAEALAPRFRDLSEEEQIKEAEKFLDAEEVDSGIVVSRGNEVRFWHLTFLEYLAARAIAGQGDDAQRKILLTGDTLHKPEWREVLLLLGGILHVKQGVDRVDGLFSAVLKKLGKKPSLAKQARCAGLLGAIVRDLTPLDYKPSDPLYRKTLDAVMGIFDAKKSKGIDFKVRLEAAEALGQAGDPRLAEDNWVTIEAGAFLMGAQKKNRSEPNYDEEADANLYHESPVHEVKLGRYQINRFPVTVQEFSRFIEHGGYTEEQCWQAGGFGENEKPEDWNEQLPHPTCPVVSVSWYEAAAYCAWAACRLPAEAEWEFASRGKEARKYLWGKEEPDASRANYGSNVSAPTPVGLYPLGVTPEGLADMAGNVWEWVSDWYGEYSPRLRENPRGPAKGSRQVLRGGSYFSPPQNLRASVRNRNQPGHRGSSIGFRCAREVPSP